MIWVSCRLISQEFAVYRGFKLLYRSYTKEGEVLLSTTDPNIAAELDFQERNGNFSGRVPKEQVTEFSTEKWMGELDGTTVYIWSESDDEYGIETDCTLAEKWNLQRVDKLDWGGAVPKSAMTRVWCERRTWKNP